MAKITLVALCLIAFLAAAHCRNIRSVSENEDFFYFQLENGTIIIKEDLTKPVVETTAFSPNDVTLYLYTTKTGKDSPCKVTSDSCLNWENCGFDANKRTVVLVHGYTANYQSPGVQVIKDAYLQKKTDVNVVILDYKPVNSPYLTAVSSAKPVGQTAAKVFAFLKDNCGLKFSKTECVGHSLGSHVCGLFSAALPEKLSRIVCLDAAAPLIGAYGVNGRLDATDADFVHCIHTSKDFLGQTKAIGHNDFYPNAPIAFFIPGCPWDIPGRNFDPRNIPGMSWDEKCYWGGATDQVGCADAGLAQNLVGSCDHSAACTIFADSILYPNMFPAHKECDSADQALSKKCTKTPSTTTYMGDPNRGPTGIFYTDSTSAYATYPRA